MSPTGYTAGVQDGKVTTFAEFAMNCARAFGALIEMRDLPNDAPIPEEFTLSQYYADSVLRDRARVAELEAMIASDIYAAAQEANAEARFSYERSMEMMRETRERYTALLAQARAWTPPTSEHGELREFMVEQLETSLDFDVYDLPAPTPRAPAAWHAAELRAAHRSLSYSIKAEQEERERVAGRNVWVKALRESLAAHPHTIKGPING